MQCGGERTGHAAAGAAAFEEGTIEAGRRVRFQPGGGNQQEEARV